MKVGSLVKMISWVSQLRPSQAEEGGCTRVSQTRGKKQILSPDSHQATEGMHLGSKDVGVIFSSAVGAPVTLSS